MKKLLLPFVAFVFFSISASQSFACSCMMPEDPLTSMKNSESVFSGTVKNISLKDMTYNVEFEVETSGKGTKEKLITLETAEQSATCGYNFEKEKEYLVYAYKQNDGSLAVSLCSRTAQLSNALEDVRALTLGRNAGTEGEFCGGIANLSCQSGLVCNITETYPDAGGSCIIEEPSICTMQYDPVCGVNGKTYGNTCSAGKNLIAYTGECSTPEKIESLEKTFGKNTLSLLEKSLTQYKEKISNITQEEQNISHTNVIKKAEKVQDEINDTYNNLSQNTLREQLFNLISLLKLRVAAMIQ